jgi:Uma2 family endonuclease
VVKRPSRQQRSPVVDWKRWYFTEEDDMGESPEQHDIGAVLEQILKELARERGWTRLMIGGNAFFQWVPKHPMVQVSPDVYVVDSPPGRPPRCFQTWKPGIHPPRLAVEIVSQNKKKDFKDAPARYASLGCKELIIFDPAATRRSRKPMLTVYRRDDDGRFVLRSEGAGPVHSEVANAWFLPAKRADGTVLLRVARDSHGRDLIPTPSERAESEAQARSEAERAKSEAERAKSEAERTKDEAERARDAAQRRVTELEAELKRRSTGR